MSVAALRENLGLGALKPVTILKRRARNLTALSAIIREIHHELALRGIQPDDLDMGMTLRLQATSDGHYLLHITQRSKKK